jgi:pimeloyl-ACP methyl ester carboxylesterase
MTSAIVRWFLIVPLLLVAHGAIAGSFDEPRRISFPLSDGNRIEGYIYSADEHRPVLIMIHGASDTHTVFDFAPGFRAARDLADEIDVVTIDRVGYGASSHPDGDSLDYATQAAQLHDVIQQVRDGALGFRPRSLLVLGPSVGGDVVLVEAGTYHDVDGAIVCSNTSELQPALFQVDVDAWFAQGPYFDFGVDFRTTFFYAAQYALQWVIDLDNATRSLVPRAEIESALANEAAPYRSQVSSPVLLMQAAEDALFVPLDDSALFTSSPDVTFTLIPRSGHKMFEHPLAIGPAVETIRRWVLERFR